MQPGNVFAQYVELNVYNRPWLYVAEIGVLKRIGYYGNLECVCARVAHSQRYTVYCYAAFVDSKITLAGHLCVLGILEREVGAAVGVFHCGAYGGLVDVALHDVAVKASVHEH